MFSRYTKFAKRPLAERVRFLFTGTYWVRVDHNDVGLPAGVAVGFNNPEDAKEATPEEIEQIQAQIAANRQAHNAQLEAAAAEPPATPPTGRQKRRQGKRR